MVSPTTATVASNDTLQYTVTVTNNAPVPVASFVVNEPLPANTTPVSWTTSSPGWTLTSPSGNPGAFTASLASGQMLAPGASATFLLTAQINPVPTTFSPVVLLDQNGNSTESVTPGEPTITGNGTFSFAVTESYQSYTDFATVICPMPVGVVVKSWTTTTPGWSVYTQFINGQYYAIASNPESYSTTAGTVTFQLTGQYTDYVGASITEQAQAVSDSGGNSITSQATDSFSVIVQPIATTIHYTGSTSATVEQSVNFSANVTPTSIEGTVNVGSVTFTLYADAAETQQVGSPVTAPVDASGIASAAYTLADTIPSGTYYIGAVYNPAGNFTESSDGSQTLVIAPLFTSIAAVNTVVDLVSAIQSATLSATVTSANGAPVMQGSVAFAVYADAADTQQIGSTVTGNVNANGVASVNFPLDPNYLGTLYVVAAYQNNAFFSGSTDSSHTLTVQAATTITANNPMGFFANVNQSIALSASVCPVDGIGTVSGGSVTFSVYADSAETQQIGSSITSTVDATGLATATFTLAAFTKPGIYPILAIYNPTAEYTGSTDNSEAMSVDYVLTITTFNNVSVPFSPIAQSVPLSASVTPLGGFGTITVGTVIFDVYSDTAMTHLVGLPVSGSLDTTGHANASFTMPANTPVGTLYVVATYPPVYGNYYYFGSSDASHTITVTKDSSSITTSKATTILTAAAQTLSFSATVTPASGLGTVSDGSVTFNVYSDAAATQQIGSPVTANVGLTGVAYANYTLPAGSPAGTYYIVATYNSGSIYAGSTSSTQTLVVEATAPTTVDTLFSFTTTKTDPFGNLIEDANGDLFGTTEYGGASNLGSVYEIMTGSNGAITTLASFNGTNGSKPLAGVIEDANGNLFGTTSAGGTSNYGTIFEVVQGSDTITTLATFVGTNGASPYGGLVEDANGNLFGTTHGGSGAGAAGTVFELAYGSNTITTLADFTGTGIGAGPYAALVEDANGNLFGTTYNGGTSGEGTAFELVHGSNTITTLVTFNGTNGSHPYDALIENANGDFFGTTSAGGNGYGTVFELTPQSGGYTITTLATFNGSGNGGTPEDSLVEDNGGNLFGTTSTGGTLGLGTVFELANGSGTITPLVAFNGTDGASPQDGLIEDSNGNLFGTSRGGAYGDGSVYEVSVAPAATATTLVGNGPNPSLSGVGVGFTVDVTSASPISGEVVTIEDASNNNAVVATPTLTNGTVTFSLSSLSLGSHDLFAVYMGDSANVGSQSGTVTQTLQSTFGVNSVTATPDGVVLTFNAPIDPNTTVLYSSPGDTTLGAADVTMVGATTGPVRGSLVIDSTDPYMATFVQTSGLLAAGHLHGDSDQCRKGDRRR